MRAGNTTSDIRDKVKLSMSRSGRPATSYSSTAAYSLTVLTDRDEYEACADQGALPVAPSCRKAERY